MLAADALAVSGLRLAGGAAVEPCKQRRGRGLTTCACGPPSIVFLAAYAMLGLYPGVGLSPVEELRRLVLGTTIVYLVASASIVLTRETEFLARRASGRLGLLA